MPMAAIGEYGGVDLTDSKALEDVGTSYTPFLENDVLIAKITPCFENGKGALATGLKNGAAYGTTELHVVSCGAALLPEFAFYLSICTPFRRLGEGSMYGAGGQKRVPETFVKDLRFGVPPVEIQRAILAFLNTKLGEIDDLIVKKRGLLALLAEKRSALITHAVTKGIDPTAPMKPSGIDWLGDIPAHWEIRRLRFIAALNKSRQPDHLKDDDTVSFVPMTAIGENNELDPSTTKSIFEIGTGYTPFKENDVIVAKITPCFENGKGAIARDLKNGFAYGTSELFVLTALAFARPDFIYLLTKSRPFRDQGESIMTGAGGQKRISSNFIKDFLCPLPPLEEQAEIELRISEMLGEFEKTSSLVTRAIAQLTEYRSAIITKAVTGNLEVS